MTDLLDRPSTGVRPRIDPRIARRWIDARRQEGRRRLQLLAGAGAVVAAAALAAGSLYSPLFQVRHVRITVRGPMAVAAVARVVGVGRGAQTIDVHPSAIAARLDADPWLGRARVSRHWPGTVMVEVTVRSPLAVIARPAGGAPVSGAPLSGAPAAAPLSGAPAAAPGAGGWAEVDATGRVLADVATPPPGLPQVQGPVAVPPPGSWLAGTPGAGVDPDAPPAGLVDMAAGDDSANVPSGPAAALAFLRALPPLLRADILTVSVGPHGAISAVLSPPRMAAGTVTVVLGDGSELQSKANALLTILQEGDLSGVGGLDLSVPDRPTTAAWTTGLAPASVAPAPAPSGGQSPVAAPAGTAGGGAPPGASAAVRP